MGQALVDAPRPATDTTPDLPKYVQIEPVGQCNLRCEMCPIQFRHDGPPWGPPAFMKFDTFTRVIDGFAGLRDLHLQGLGEPMMHPRFFDMVEYAVKKGVRVTTNSNLTLLTAVRAERAVTSGLAALHVSIDGATPETYASIRVRGRLDRVVANVERLVAARSRLTSPTPRLHLVVVIMKRNLHELPDLVRLARRLSFEEVFVQHLCHDFAETTLPAEYRPMRDYVERETLLSDDPGRIDRFFSAARGVAREQGIVLRLPATRPREHAPGTPGPARCDWPWRGAYVSYQGLAMPCCMISTPDRLNFGNIDEQGVEATWHGREYQEFRARLGSDDPPAICRSCAVYRGTF